jgi:hypothetical protein
VFYCGKNADMSVAMWTSDAFARLLLVGECLLYACFEDLENERFYRRRPWRAALGRSLEDCVRFAAGVAIVFP